MTKQISVIMPEQAFSEKTIEFLTAFNELRCSIGCRHLLDQVSSGEIDSIAALKEIVKSPSADQRIKDRVEVLIYLQTGESL